MVQDLAVWEGSEPTSEDDAGRAYDELYRLHFEEESWFDPESATPPSDRIRAFVYTLLDRWPDPMELAEDQAAESPWGMAPVLNDARGPIVCISIAGNEAGEELAAFAVATATETGLVCFDTVQRRLIEA